MRKNWYKKAVDENSLSSGEDEDTMGEEGGDNFSEELPEEEGEEEEMRFKSKPFNDVCYHGTDVQPGEALFDELNMNYSDHEAIWVTDEEDIAEEYSRRNLNSYRPEANAGHVQVVFKVNVAMQNAAQINSLEEWKEFTLNYSLDMNLLENIPFLRSMGYDGWITLGGMGSRGYKDIAIFNPSAVNILEVKVMTSTGWTAYMPVREAQELVAQMQGVTDEG